MVLKGNLCWNGDLEAGTTEGWSNEYWDFLKPTLSVEAGAGVDGSNALKAEAGTDTGWYGFWYKEDFPFEDREVYRVEVKLKKGNISPYSLICFKDAYKRILGHLLFGVGWSGGWDRQVAFVGSLFGAEYFSVGFLFYGGSGYYVYVDELSVVGLRNERTWGWMDTYEQTYSGEGYTVWECGVAVFFKHSYQWIFDVRELTGTSPSLTLKLQQDVMMDKHDIGDKFLDVLEEVSGITSTGRSQKVNSTTKYGYYNIRMETSGSDTSAKVKHVLKLIPFI